jgi:hypothetical protein
MLTLVFLQISSSNARAHHPSRSVILDEQDSFMQYSTDRGKIIIAKPLHQPQGGDSAFDDFLHITVACSLALVLVTLLGLVIRHYGLKWPTLSERPVTRYRRRATDTENGSQMNKKKVGLGLGFDAMEGTNKVVKPAEAYLKWR